MTPKSAASLFGAKKNTGCAIKINMDSREEVTTEKYLSHTI